MTFVEQQQDDSVQEWGGELADTAAKVILHQHAIQSDLTEFQVTVIRWRTLFDKVRSQNGRMTVDYKLVHQALMDIDKCWTRGPPSDTTGVDMFPEESQVLHQTLEEFVEYLMFLIKKHREKFPPRHKPSIAKLENVLR